MTAPSMSTILRTVTAGVISFFVLTVLASLLSPQTPQDPWIGIVVAALVAGFVVGGVFRLGLIQTVVVSVGVVTATFAVGSAMRARYGFAPVVGYTVVYGLAGVLLHGAAARLGAWARGLATVDEY